MELFTRLSVALVDPDVVSALADLPCVTTRNLNPSLERLKTTLEAVGHTDVIPLIDRQWHYANEVAATAPSSLTSF